MALMEEDILPSRRTCGVRLVKNDCTQLSVCGEIAIVCEFVEEALVGNFVECFLKI